jgi:hypothetical protein
MTFEEWVLDVRRKAGAGKAEGFYRAIIGALEALAAERAAARWAEAALAPLAVFAAELTCDAPEPRSISHWGMF